MYNDDSTGCFNITAVVHCHRHSLQARRTPAYHQHPLQLVGQKNANTLALPSPALFESKTAGPLLLPQPALKLAAPTGGPCCWKTGQQSYSQNVRSLRPSFEVMVSRLLRLRSFRTALKRRCRAPWAWSPGGTAGPAAPRAQPPQPAASAAGSTPSACLPGTLHRDASDNVPRIRQASRR